MKHPLAVYFLAALACSGADVTGSWSGSYYAGPVYLILKQKGSEITGTAGPTPAQQMLNLERGRIEGDRVTFKAGPLEADLRLYGDDLKGDLKEPNDTAPLTLTRVEALARRPQPGPAQPFEVATVKQNKTGTINGITGRGGQIRPSKGQIAMENVTLWKALGFAYGIGEDKDYAITGPAWLKSERYDIVAKVPAGVAWDQMLRMLQATLAERFHLELHRESKDLPIYALVPARDGLKLHAGEPGRSSFRFGAGRIQAQSAPLGAFADRLSQILGRPVIDKTGAAGTFDFTLEWSPDQPIANPGEESASSGGQAIFTALQQQLGMRLEARRGPVDVLVVDRGEKIPVEN
jgi:uncharacterized protein (TIGR03435 family)